MPPSCRPRCSPSGAVPPLVTDIDLSIDDRWLFGLVDADE